MTDRLYLSDPYLVSFTARVVAGSEQGGRPSAILDRTAFYPEGGGQPADRGTLGGAQVVDVQESGSEVVHLLDRPLAPGTEVEGQVDWQRRLDHMQQHHGQHLLSAAFERVHGAPTRSFHLGEQKWGQGASRVEFVCGGRVVRLVAEQGRCLSGAADALKTAARDLPEAARRIAEESNARRKLAAELERDLSRSRAEEMVREA